MFTVLLLVFAASVSVLSHRAHFSVHSRDTPEVEPALIQTLAALREEYSSLHHPAFPDYSVRIKRSSFCDATVQAYTGYIDIGARHIFFYFFESRNSPETDPVVLWTEGEWTRRFFSSVLVINRKSLGGPGCSAALGMFVTLGPCQITGPGGPKLNPHSWTRNASVFFVDSPVGVGFSYADGPPTPVKTTEDAAVDIAAFIAIFFEQFSAKFKGRDFHMASSSYGGRYLPLFAAALYDQNTRLAGLVEPVNLRSIMIGNGMTDMRTLIPTYYDFQCSDIAVAPIQGVGTCVQMKLKLPRCKSWMKSACTKSVDDFECGASYDYCNKALAEPFYATNKNPYDIRRDCEGDITETNCYPVVKYTTDYLDRPEVRSYLGVDPSLTEPFAMCSNEVSEAFRSNLDELHPTTPHVAALLEHGVRVLIYAGVFDWVCNWLSNEIWTLELEWSGQKEFRGQELREWTVDGKPAGKARSSKGLLTFATVEGAGHMVPYDKPVEALAMVNKWMSEGGLL